MDLPSKRYRSRQSLGGRINKIRNSVSKSDNTSIPSTVGSSSVNSASVIRDSISSETIAYSSIESTTFSTSAYIPNGETNQRVPAPLSETLYWTRVTEGLIELHLSAIHGSGELEDIQNVTATNEGLVFDATNGTARIYLTGRLPIPKSKKVFSTWTSDLPIDMKLIYWVQSPTYFIEGALRRDGVSQFDLNTNNHSVALGDTIRVVESSPDFNGLYSVVGVDSDTVRATSYQNRYDLVVSSSVYTVNTATAVMTVTGVNTDDIRISENDLVVLSNELVDGFGGHYRITNVDDTTTANTIVLSFEMSTYDSDISGSSFYNSGVISVYTGTTRDTVTNQNYSPYGRISVDQYHYIKLADRDVWGADGYTLTVVEASLAGNIATLKTSQAHYLSVGDFVRVVGVDSHLGYDDVFDVEVAIVASVDATNKTFTYSIFPNSHADIAVNTNSSSVVLDSLGSSVAITKNQHNPAEYAIYAELEQTVSSPIRTLSTAKAFEVVGDEKTRFVYANISNVNITSNVVTIGLDSSVPAYSGNVTVSVDGALSSIINGDFQIVSTSGSNLVYSVSNVIDVATTSAIGFVQGQVPIRHSEISPDGVIFYSADGSVQSRLGSGELDAVSLANASIDVAGEATFTSVATGNTAISGTLGVDGASTFNSPVTANADVRIYSPVSNNTANLYGSADGLRYHRVLPNATGVYAQTNSVSYYTGDILSRFARGLVYSVNYGGLGADNTITLTDTRYTLASGSFTLEPNRNYLFVVSPGSLGLNTGTNVALRYQFVASNNIAIANYAHNTQSGTGFADVRQSSRFGAGYVGPLSPLVFNYQTTSNTAGLTNGFSNTHIYALSEIFWMLRLEYAATAHTNAIVQDSGNKNSQLGVNIYDMGPAYANSIGVISNTEAWAVTGTFAGGAVAPNTVTVTETVFANSTTSAYFDNYGIGDSGTSDPYANQNSIYQGDPGTASGTKKSQVAFESVTAVIPDYATKLASQNLVVTNIEVYLRNRHSYSASGLTTYIGCSTDTNARNSTAPPAPITAAGQTSTSFTKGQGKYTTLGPTTRSYFANGTARSILISLKTASSNTYDSTSANYGYFDGDLQSDPPKLRITYTYTVAG